MSSLAVSNVATKIPHQSDTVPLSDKARVIHKGLSSSVCSFDDESIISEACYPKRFHKPTFGFFNPHIPKSADDEKKLSEYYSMVDSIEADKDFIMLFKQQFLKASNREKNAIAEHATRILNEYWNAKYTF